MDGSDSYLHADGSLLVPIAGPASWPEQYFYVVKRRDEHAEPFEPLRCIGLSEPEVRRSTRRVPLEGWPAVSLLVSVLCSLDTPGGYVLPWQIRVGDQTFASLHPPPWVIFAPAMGEGSVSHALKRVVPDSLAIEREVRLRHVEIAMRSSKLLDHIRVVSGRRMAVQWFDEDQVWGESTFTSGRELFDALIDPATRNRPHLIGFPDGWYVNGINWLT